MAKEKKWKWPLPIVEVEWLDCMGYDAWEPVDALLEKANRPGRMTHFTCGYLLESNDKHVITIGSFSMSTEMCSDTTQIPRGAIVKIRRLKCE